MAKKYGMMMMTIAIFNDDPSDDESDKILGVMTDTVPVLNFLSYFIKGFVHILRN